jgi:hypothetical protein
LSRTGAPGIESRTGPTTGNHQVIVIFSVPITVQNVTVTPGVGGNRGHRPEFRSPHRRRNVTQQKVVAELR